MTKEYGRTNDLDQFKELVRKYNENLDPSLLEEINKLVESLPLNEELE